jgi:hypothetical protein
VTEPPGHDDTDPVSQFSDPALIRPYAEAPGPDYRAPWLGTPRGGRSRPRWLKLAIAIIIVLATAALIVYLIR